MTEPPLRTLIVSLTFDRVVFGRDLAEWLVEPTAASGTIAADTVEEYLEDLALLSVTAPADLAEHHREQLHARIDTEALTSTFDACLSTYACVLPVSLPDVDIAAGEIRNLEVAVVVLTPLASLDAAQERLIARHVRLQVRRDPEKWHPDDLRDAVWTSEPFIESFDGTCRDEEGTGLYASVCAPSEGRQVAANDHAA